MAARNLSERAPVPSSHDLQGVPGAVFRLRRRHGRAAVRGRSIRSHGCMPPMRAVPRCRGTGCGRPARHTRTIVGRRFRPPLTAPHLPSQGRSSGNHRIGRDHRDCDRDCDVDCCGGLVSRLDTGTRSDDRSDRRPPTRASPSRHPEPVVLDRTGERAGGRCAPGSVGRPTPAHQTFSLDSWSRRPFGVAAGRA